MQFFYGVPVDTATMTTEELQRSRTKIQEILAIKQHQIMTSHLARHRHLANYSELKEEQTNLQEMLSNISHQINTRKIAEHRFAK